MKASSVSAEKKTKDDSFTNKERYSLSGIVAPKFPAFSFQEEKLKSFYMSKKGLIADTIIPTDIHFPGLNIRSYQLPKFYESNNLRSTIFYPSPPKPIDRCTSDGLFCSSEDSPRSQQPVILSKSNLNEVFPQSFFLPASKEHATIAVISKVDLDGRNLNQYLEYLWSDPSINLWLHIDYLYRIDLSKLLSEEFYIFTSGDNPSIERILAKLILKNLDPSFTESSIISLFSNPSSVFLIDGFNEILPYIGTERYSYIENLIAFITGKFNVLINAGKHTSSALIDRFSPTKIVYNDGYNNKHKIFSYIFKNFGSETYYERLVDFIKFNQPIQQMCESPSFLMSVSYIIANYDKLGHTYGLQEATLSSIYYDLYLLANNNFNSKFPDNESKLSTKSKFIAFIKEFALLQIVLKDSIDINQILTKYTLSQKELHFMMIHFPSLKADTTTKITSNYVFIDNQYRDFIAAFYLKDLLQSGDKTKITFVTKTISENVEQEQLIKFLAGIIALERNEAEKTLLIDLVLKAIEANTDQFLRIDLDNLITLLMKIIDKFKDEALSIIPIRDKMLDINKIIIEDPLKWHTMVIEANYHVSAIEERYRAKLFSNLPEDQSLAIDYYSKVKISNSATRTSVADRLVTLSLNSENLVIRESSIKALEVYDDIATVNAFFQEVISNPQEVSSIIISVLETMAEDGNPSNIPMLISVLGHKNPYVVFKTIEALEKSHRTGIEDHVYLESLFTLLINYEPSLPKEVYTLVNRIYLKRNFDISSLMANLIKGIKAENTNNMNQDCLDKIHKLISYKIFESDQIKTLWNINEIIRNIITKLEKSQPTPLSSLLSTRSENQRDFEILTIKFLMDHFQLLSDYKIKRNIKDKVFKILKDGEEVTRLNIFDKIDLIYYEYHNEVIDLFTLKLGNTHLLSLKTAIIKFLLVKINPNFSKPEIFAFNILINYQEKLSSILKIIKKILLSSEDRGLTDNCLEFIYYYYYNKPGALELGEYIQTIKTKQLSLNSKNFFKLISLNPTNLDFHEIKEMLNLALDSSDPETIKVAFYSITPLILNQAISNRDKSNYFELMLQKLTTIADSEMIILVLDAISGFINVLQLSNYIVLIDFSISKISNPQIEDKVKLKLLNDILINSINSATITTSSIQLEETLSQIIFGSGNLKLIAAASHVLIKIYIAMTYSDLESKIYSNFIEPFSEQQTDDYTKVKIIRFMGVALNYVANKSLIFNFLLTTLDIKEALIDESLQAIRINLNFLKTLELIDLIKKVKIFIDSKGRTTSIITDSHIIELIADIDHLLNERNLSLLEFKEAKSSFDYILYKIIASQNTIPNIQFIDGLAAKVFISKQAITKKEISNLNSLVEYIAYRIVHAKSNFNARTLIKLLQFIDKNSLNKLNYITTNELRYLQPREQSDKATFLLKMLEDLEESSDSSFSEEYGLIQSLKTILTSKDILVEEYFPSIQSILDDLPQFSLFISQHRLPVIFTQQELKVGKKKYIISANKDPETLISVSREIYLALTTTVHAHVLIKPVLTDSIFFGYSAQQLDLQGLSQFSILQRMNQNGDRKQIYFLIEQATIFGNTQIACFTWVNKVLKISYYFSNDENFRTNILGIANEYDSYEVETFSIIDRGVLASIKSELLKTSQDLDHFIQSIFPILGEPKRLSIKHNELIGFDGYNERLVKVEREQAVIRSTLEEIRETFARFELKQKSLEHLLSIKLNYNKYSEDIFEGLLPYQTGLVKTIIFQLETIFDAARVVQTEMVANSQKGICGNIGALFSSIAPNIPFAGPAVWFFGSILSAYDAKVQERIASNIASLAIRSSDAKQIIEVVALFFVKYKFKLPEQSTSDGLIEYINTVIDGTNAVLSDGIISTIVTKVSEKIAEIIVEDHTERKVSDEQKGEEDGAIIVNLLIPLISSGKCKFSTNRNQQIELIKRFLENAVHLEIVSSPLAIVIHPIASSSANTESKTQDLLTQNAPKADIPLPAILPVVEESNRLLQDPISLEQNLDFSLECAIAGGALMKGMEVWNSIKYLGTNYIPIIPTMHKYGLYSTFLIENEHYITSFLYGLGAISFTLALGISPIYATVGTLVYFAKPYIYHYENEFFKLIDQNENVSTYVKIPIYFITEVSITTATSLPFINLNAFYAASFIQKFSATLPLISQAALTTSIKIFYIENPDHRSSDMTYYLAEGTTTAVIISNSLIKYSQYILVKDSLPYTLKEAYIIINVANAVTLAHTTHQLTTYLGDLNDHSTEIKSDTCSPDSLSYNIEDFSKNWI